MTTDTLDIQKLLASWEGQHIPADMMPWKILAKSLCQHTDNKERILKQLFELSQEMNQLQEEFDYADEQVVILKAAMDAVLPKGGILVGSE